MSRSSNFAPQIAADDSATVVWTARPQAGSCGCRPLPPKDGAFGPVQTLTDRLLYAFEPQVAIDERGNATAVWTLTARSIPLSLRPLDDPVGLPPARLTRQLPLSD